MERVVKIIKLKDETEKNSLYWRSTTIDERLSAIQRLREQYIILFNKQDLYNESRKRLRRVCRAIKRTKS